MKKIGIFTFFQTNYGAVLQAYALQKYLQDRPDTDVEIIDFTTPTHLKSHKVFQKQKSKNPLFILSYYLFSIIHYRQLKRRIERTWDFKKNYYHFTRRYSTVKDVLENHPIKDVYVTGSDQVFNPNTPSAQVYYLDFDKGKGKKVAYAPSFGISEFNEGITAKIERCIRDFDHLSCREPAGAEYLKSIVGRDVPVVVDPVLLHDSKEWSKVAISPKYKEEYIFIYDLNGAENLIKIAKNIQKRTHLPVVCLTGNRTKIYPVNKQIYDAGPAEFIGWIKDASYVVTDSFHGTVFSLIFRKQFFTFVAVEKTSSRIKNILEKAGALNRMLVKEQLIGFDVDSYNSSEFVSLVDMVESSKEYVNEFLS